MTMRKVMTAALAGALLTLGGGVSDAKAEGLNIKKENFMFRLRGVGVLPNEDQNLTGGTTVDIDNTFVPEFDITYFWTDHIATELILATTPHDVTVNPATSLGDVWLLPPTLTLQYHFTPDQTFSPYVGAGINYTIFYNEDPGAFASVDYDNSVGFALQAGFDYWVNENWGLNLDVKRLWLDTDVNVNAGAVTGSVDIDPWIVGAGISYRF